eukprot:tig00020537_g10288.t1
MTSFIAASPLSGRASASPSVAVPRGEDAAVCRQPLREKLRARSFFGRATPSKQNTTAQKTTFSCVASAEESDDGLEALGSRTPSPGMELKEVTASLPWTHRNTLKIGVPKGSLQESTFRMLRKAGYTMSLASDRSYFPSVDDSELEPIMLRAQDMSRYVADGALDCGICGNDWILENGRDVVRVAQLEYSKQTMARVRWVLAVPEHSGIKRVEDLRGKRVATELLEVTKEYFRQKNVDVEVEFSWGATEVKVSAGLADAIVDLTETGRSLSANRLIILDTICWSTTEFIANEKAWSDPWKRQKMEQMAMLLQGAIAAEAKVGLKLNCLEKDLPAVVATLPALKRPTVSPLTEDGWVAVETILDEKVVRSLIPRLKEAGAEGLIEYPLNKVIP